MSRRPNITRHGLNHTAGGSDPIPGLGGGGDSTHNILACWGGVLPLVTGPGVVWRVPEVDGASATFTLAKAVARLETTGSGSTVLTIEKSSGGGGFAASTVTILTVAAGTHEVANTSIGVSVTTGDLLRLYFSTIGVTSTLYSVEIEGTD